MSTIAEEKKLEMDEIQGILTGNLNKHAEWRCKVYVVVLLSQALFSYRLLRLLAD